MSDHFFGERSIMVVNLVHYYIKVFLEVLEYHGLPDRDYLRCGGSGKFIIYRGVFKTQRNI